MVRLREEELRSDGKSEAVKSKQSSRRETRKADFKDPSKPGLL